MGKLIVHSYAGASVLNLRADNLTGLLSGISYG